MKKQMIARPENCLDAAFIRLLFIDPVEEKIAHRWAERLAGVVGSRVLGLRPSTSLDEILQWAADAGAQSMQFVNVFEPELRMELADFLEQSNETTFRQMVEHYAARFGPRE